MREGGLHLPPATVAPLKLIRDFELGATKNIDTCNTIARKVLQSLRTTVNTLGVEPAHGTIIVRYTDRTSPNVYFQLSVRSEVVARKKTTNSMVL